MASEKDEKALKVQLETLQSLVDSGYQLLSQTRPPDYGLDIDLSTLLPPPAAGPADVPPGGTDDAQDKPSP